MLTLKRSGLALATVGLVLGVSASAWAQGEIRGTVVDTGGGILPGVTITALQVDTGETRTAATSDIGVYRLPALALGPYVITAELQGFAAVKRDGITLGLGQTLTVNFTMDVSGVQETITVTGEAPLINVTTAEVAGLLQPVQIENLPILGRNWMDLGMLMPGVTSTATHTRGVATGRGNAWAQAVIIDGVDSRDECCVRYMGQHSQETIAEFRIIANNFSAEYGRSSGYVLSAVTKSGTNVLHGTGFYLFRDEQMDKVDFFTNRKEPIKYYQVGGSIGGPIKQDRIFFFGGLERAYDERTGFSQTGFPELDNVKVPVTAWQNYALAKVDMQARGSQRLSAKYYYWHQDDFNGSLFAGAGTSGGVSGKITPWAASDGLMNNHGVAINHTWPGGKWLNEVTFGFTYNNWYWKSKSGVPVRDGGFTNPEIDIPWIEAPSFNMGTQTATPQDPAFERKVELKNHFSYIKGRHDLKIGGNMVLGRFDLGWFRQTRGQLNFVQDPVDPFDFNRYPEPTRFQMSLGRPTALCPDNVGDRVQQEFDRLGSCGWYAPMPFRIFGGFIQDNWTVTRDLTLNLGVRYEVEDGNFALDYLDRVKPQLDPQIPHPTRNDRNNIGPRTGFSYRFRGSDKTVIRGGSGLYYNTTILNVPLNKLVNDGWNTILADQPFPTRQPCFEGHTLEEAITHNPKLLLPGCGALSFDQLYGGAAKAIWQMDPDYETERAIQSSIGVAHEVFGDMAIEADFVYIRGDDGNFATDTNLFFDPETGGPKDPRVFGRPDPRFTSITTMGSHGKSRYRALMLRVNKRLRQNYQFQANYTLAKSTDTVGGGSSPQPDNPFNREEWGPSENTTTHRLTVNGTIDRLPLGLQVSGILLAYSGFYYDDRAAGDIWNLGRATSRGYRTPDGTLVLLARNSNIGDAFVKLDLRVARWFTLGRDVRIGAMAEFFNVLNHKNYGAYGTILGSRTYQQPVRIASAQFAPLKTQVGVRLTY